MMLTPVAAAKSASDQSRASRRDRMAAPAASRLTAVLPAMDGSYTAACRELGIYVFAYGFIAEPTNRIYASVDAFNEGETTMHHPCAANPDLWFGYNDDADANGTAKARAYERAAIEARTLCLRRCPVAAQRMCAKLAVDQGEEYGVWAGVKLPGGQYRKREELAQAHDTLRRIAAGEISSREVPANAALLERREADLLPVVRAVFHLPAAQVCPRTAA